MRAGYVVPPFYDSMIAKLIGHGEDRAAAIVTVVRALEGFRIEGVKTTIPVHLKILSSPAFVSGKYDTSLVPSILSGGEDG